MMKKIGLAVALLTAPLAANAATINGQVDIAGVINVPTSLFTPIGNVDFEPNGMVILSTGDFLTNGLVGFVSSVALSDFSFLAPGHIWTAGIFSFAATSFSNIVGGPLSTTKAFKADGIISGVGFDDTKGILEFTAQANQAQVSFSSTTAPAPVPVPAAGLLLLSAFGAVAAMRRKAA